MLLLGGGDQELEDALMKGRERAVERSAGGLDVAEGQYRVVAVTREGARNHDRRPSLVKASARALTEDGTLVLEVPNALGRLSQLLLAYEGLTLRNFTFAGGTSYGGLRRLLRRTGFRRLSGFLCLPSLADPRVVLPLDSNPAMAAHYAPPFFVESSRRRLLRRALVLCARLGLLRWISPGFVFVATRGGDA